MKEKEVKKEKIKKSKKTSKEIIIIILIWCVIAIMALIATLVKNLSNNYGENVDYQKIECHPMYVNTSGNGKYEFISTYQEYCDLIKKYNYKLKEINKYTTEVVEPKYNEQFFESKNLLAVYFFNIGSPIYDTDLIDFKEKENTVKLKISGHSDGVTADRNEHVFLFSVSKDVNNVLLAFPYCDSIDFELMINLGIIASILILLLSIIINILSKNEDWKTKTKKSIALIFIILAIYIALNMPTNNRIVSAYKPIIYLYPEESTEVSVELGYPENITCSYPKYINGWNVLANPDGDLVDLNTNRNLYALYYENKNSIDFKVENYGFVVKGKDTAEFLEEKLKILGLNERETEEFIIYWLPKLEANKYNYIRFATEDELSANMPLQINPTPDTTIRVLMTYKGLNKPISVENQELKTPERKRFVAVEWGGTEIK